MSDGNVTGSCERDRVYLAIKARAIGCCFGAGQPIRLNELAAQLGVSTTPIRAALNMLVAEGLVGRRPRRGFVAMNMSEDRFIGLYRLNQHLLDAALTLHDASAKRLAVTCADVAGIGDELGRGEAATPDAIADSTGRLFVCIARLSANAQVVESVERINDGLRYLRTLEPRHLDDVPGELIDICELLLAERFDEAATAIGEYHASRLAVLPKLLVALGN